jgi:uncharacterized protein (DUF427 family)
MQEALEDQHVNVIARPGSDFPVRIEPYGRRIRAFIGGVPIADSTSALLVLEDNHLPVYYLPREDVRMDLLERTSRTTQCPYKGDASYWNVRVGGETRDNAAWSYEDPIEEVETIKGYIALYWDQVDAWFEEDDQVYMHPRDPYHRVDVLNSSRHVRVVVGGETVAETHRPRLLFETGLPTRYYFPKLDVRMDLLEPTEKRTRCPYKGEALYWNVTAGGRVFEDLVWSYPAPIPECPKIENLLSFFNEHVEIYVDGELQPVPKTPWSE